MLSLRNQDQEQKQNSGFLTQLTRLPSNYGAKKQTLAKQEHARQQGLGRDMQYTS